MRILTTERLTLRTLEDADAPMYLRLVNEPSFIRNIGDRGLRTVDAALDVMRKGTMAMQAERGFSMYVVELADGTPIGMCGLIKREALEDVDLGYAYFPEFWGRGYACEAARGVVGHARRDIGLARLAAIVSPHNAGSIGVLRKLGFEFQKVIRMTEDDPGTNLYKLGL